MGGEWSKTVGEHGEAVVAELLTMLGWGEAQAGVAVSCIAPERHGSAASPRQNHGIDYLFSYRSQLCDDLGENLYISSKYTANAYPKTPSSIFKSYYRDLAEAMHCLKKSEDYRKQTKMLSGCTKYRNIGIVMWLSNEDPYASCKEAVSRIEIPSIEDQYDGLYLIDNEDAGFLYDAISFVRNIDHQAQVTFTYIDSGKITDPTFRQFSGSVLPFEYSTMGLLPLKVVKGDVARLVLCCKAAFEESELGRLIGLSQSISQGWASSVRILLPDYNELKHGRSIARMKNAFADTAFTSKLTVGSFRPTLQTMANE